MYVKESDFPAVMRNSFVYTHDKSSAEEKISRRVKAVVSVFEPGNLISYQRNLSYRPTTRKKEEIEVHVTYLL